MLGPGGQEAVGRQHVELVLEETLHPLDVVILPPDLQLLRDQVAELAPGNDLQLLQSLLEHLRQVVLDLHCFFVDFVHLLPHLRQQLLQLVLPLLQVRVHLVDLGRDLGEVVSYLL